MYAKAQAVGAELVVPIKLLGVALIAIVVVGWIAGLVLLRALGDQTLAHLDLPAKAFFSRHRQPDLFRAMQDVTIAGSDRAVLPVALAAGVWWRWRRSSWLPLLVTVAAYVGGAFIAVSDKVAVGRGRPSGHGLSGLTFPSGHATQAMAVYGTIGGLAILWAGRRSARLVIGAAAGLVIGGVALSRLYLGAHRLTDVLAGLALGAMWVAALRASPQRGVASASTRVKSASGAPGRSRPFIFPRKCWALSLSYRRGGDVAIRRANGGLRPANVP